MSIRISCIYADKTGLTQRVVAVKVGFIGFSTKEFTTVQYLCEGYGITLTVSCRDSFGSEYQSSCGCKMCTVSLFVLCQEIIDEVFVPWSRTRPYGIRNILLEIIRYLTNYLLWIIAIDMCILDKFFNNLSVILRNLEIYSG